MQPLIEIHANHRQDAFGHWKAVIRKTGFPTAIKTFRLKRDAEDWARTAEDEMVRGMFVKRSPSERLTLEAAMKRYLAEVAPTKRPFTQQGEKQRSAPLVAHFGKYALAGVTSGLVAAFGDKLLAGEDRLKDGEPRPRAPNTVRLELALLGHLFTVGIKEWGIGLAINLVLSIRRPAPGPGRKRFDPRLSTVVEVAGHPCCPFATTNNSHSTLRAFGLAPECSPQHERSRNRTGHLRPGPPALRCG